MKDSTKDMTKTIVKDSAEYMTKAIATNNDAKHRRPLLMYISVLVIMLVIMLLLVLLLTPVHRYPLSLAVMKVSNRLNHRGSLEEEAGIKLYIPGGGITAKRDWYPFVMNYKADALFDSYMGQSGGRLSIYYNFAAFDIKKGCSDIYDAASPYYSSFYGAYVVRSHDHAPYGFISEPDVPYNATAIGGRLDASDDMIDGRQDVSDDTIDSRQDAPYEDTDAGPEEPCFSADGLRADCDSIARITRLDYSQLVLSDFGLPPQEQTFDWEITGIRTEDNFAGFDGWAYIKADMTVNGMAHDALSPQPLSYLQYGVPYGHHDAAFEAVRMHGILCGKYFAQKDVSIFFYVMSPDTEVCRSCMEDILRNSRLSFDGSQVSEAPAPRDSGRNP